MPQLLGDSHVRRLQEEIRQAGCITDRVGIRVLTMTAATLVAGLVECWDLVIGSDPAGALISLAGLLMLIGLSAVLVGLKCSEAYAWHRRRDFRRSLADLPPREQAAVLLPLRNSGSEAVHEIIAPLVRRLPPGIREVTPAAVPGGRGSEPVSER